VLCSLGTKLRLSLAGGRLIQQIQPIKTALAQRLNNPS
jgi:hypothetical protein